jgi:acylphosphatase
MSRERRRVTFEGRVQGVGFRYTTCQIAAQFDVTGYVQNLRDGRVLLVAEGDPAELDRFLAELESTMAPYITSTEAETLPSTGEFDGFAVRY